METVKLATAKNPLAARLIERFKLTDEAISSAKRPKWTRAQYADYLQTDHWRGKRAQALAYYGNKCYLCGVDGDAAQIDIHHNDYSRLGGELMSDMIPLCRDCHERHHNSI